MDAVERINQASSPSEKIIEGDIVECGVWKGGMSMAMMIVNQRYNTDRHFWLFDTFEGLPEPTDPKNGAAAKQVFQQLQDKVQHNTTTAQIEKYEKSKEVEDGKWNYGPLEVVRNNMQYSGYPRTKLHFVQGKVEDTL